MRERASSTSVSLLFEGFRGDELFDLLDPERALLAGKRAGLEEA